MRSHEARQLAGEVADSARRSNDERARGEQPLAAFEGIERAEARDRQGDDLSELDELSRPGVSLVLIPATGGAGLDPHPRA
jgi:hypothetical protein